MMGALPVQSNGDDGLFFPDPDPGYVEVDPTGRYGRYNEVLGKGSSKTVYRAFDEHRGMEVAWNKVHLHDFLRSPGDLERLYGEIHLLKSLRHRHVMRLHASWVDAPRRAVNFVTELFTSGTLRQYRRRHPRARAAAVRRWCCQVLDGLAYLHARGVIHRDLKCDNLFVNGSQGQVKIGDLGLAAVLRRRRGEGGGGQRCVVGTPEFMAPEVYAEAYDERADVYSFGMCVLEMVMLEYPYSECDHPVQIYKKVTSGVKPAALHKVRDPMVRRLIDKCLAPAARRPSAIELLNDDPFLQMEDDGFISYGDDDRDYGSMYNYLYQPACLLDYHPAGDEEDDQPPEDRYWDCVEEDGDDDDDDDSRFQGIDLLFNEHEDDDHVAGVDIAIKGKRMDDGTIFLRLRITDKTDPGLVRNIYFPFDTESDTALSVATEMVGELDITDHEVTHIADMIDGEVAALLPHWTPGMINDDDVPDDDTCCRNCRQSTSASSGGSLADYVSRRRGCRCAELHGRFEEITFQADEEQVQFQSSGGSSDD